jgi:hypothetical protein
VRWHARKATRQEAFAEVLAQLRRTEFKSLSIVNMVAALSRDLEDADALEEVFAAAGEAHPGVALYRLVVQRHMIRLEFEEATDAAVRWARDEIFNSDAAAMAVYLLTDVRADFDNALEIGRDALKRNPSAAMLVNNVAYALALSGHVAEARRVLPDDSNNVFVTATKALVAYLSGDFEGGRAGYELAQRLAIEAGDTDLADLAGYHALVYEARALKAAHAQAGKELVLGLPKDWETKPQLVLLAHIAEREGVPVQVGQ